MELNIKFFLKVFLPLLVICICTSCANIIPPSGGPRDSLPPNLVTAFPKDSATNVTSKKITLTFDEYVEVKDIAQQVLINPYQETQPNIDYKLKNVYINFKDSLKPNTTYSINFGNAIKDINEGNIAKNKTFVFSTGKKIDSQSIQGSVVVANDGSIDSTLVAVLQNNLSDTAVYKIKPQYVSKLDGAGKFYFNFLPDTIFNLFVIPNNFSKKYDDSTKLFGFLDKPIITKNNKENIIIYAFKQIEDKPKLNNASKSSDGREKKKLSFTTNISNGRFDILDSTIVLTSNAALNNINSKTVQLLDSNFVALQHVVFNLDSSFTKISINANLSFKTKYYIIIKTDALTDSNKLALSKSDTLAFTTFKEEDYGKLKFRIGQSVTNEKLLIYKDDVLLNTFSLAKEINIKLYKPGEYNLRILQDENQNGIWDSGNYRLKKQPEKIIALKNKLMVKANWDNEVQLIW
jgi:hypothetical protein